MPKNNPSAYPPRIAKRAKAVAKKKPVVKQVKQAKLGKKAK